MPAPYSDNLYSAVDSDDEDADAHNHSPTDGYFHASSTWGPASSSSQHQQPFSVPYIPNVLVEDPSLPANKAREAEAERLSTGRSAEGGSQLSQPSQPSLQSRRYRRSIEEDLDDDSSARASAPGMTTTSQQHPIDAPPAYTPSPSSAPVSYRTFPPPQSFPMSLQPEQQPLLPHGPESMGGDPLEPPKPCRWKRAKGCVTSPRLRRWVKYFFIVVLILIAVALATVGILFAMWDPNRSRNDHDPVRSPDMTHEDLVWEPRSGCLNRQHQFPKSTSLLGLRNDHNLEVIQDMEDTPINDGDTQINVWGEVVLRAAPPGSPGTIDFEVISNHGLLQPKIDINYATRKFKITTPLWVAWEEEMSPCIQARITVWIPARSVVDFLFIDTVHLGVDVKQGLALGVQKAAQIQTVVGNVNTPQAGLTGELGVPYTIDASVLAILTTGGDVEGWVPLYDGLVVNTASGNVNLNISSKPVDLREPWWASISIHTISGNVAIQELLEPDIPSNMPRRRIPPREYTNHVETVSGNIKAHVAWSSGGTFTSKSGDLDLRLWPVLHRDLLTVKHGKYNPPSPVLKTETTSGSTNIVILEPWWTRFATTGWPKPPDDSEDVAYAMNANASDNTAVVGSVPEITMMWSEHKTLSGPLVLRYPTAWKGVFTAKTISGSQNIRGLGLKVFPPRTPYPDGVTGIKGDGGSDMRIDTVSGDQDVLIGLEPEKIVAEEY